MKRVVTIGGGTGSFNLLTGLKKYPIDLTAVVTTFDSGGSTGVLRDEFGSLPGGDARRALVALAPEGEDQFLRELFQVRFESPGSGLHNHSFGNLLLLAAERVTSSRVQGIQKLGKLLSIKGRVLPISLDDAHLCAFLEDGTEVRGEANIDVPKHNGDLRIEKVWLEPHADLYKKTKEAIKDADIIIFGPGDLYTSIIANTLTKGFKEALKESDAKIVFISNIMNKYGETHGFSVDEHAKILLSYIGKEQFDYIFVNSGTLPADVLERYKKQKKEIVPYDDGSLEKISKKVIIENLMSDADVARHNSQKIGAAIAKELHL